VAHMIPSGEVEHLRDCLGQGKVLPPGQLIWLKDTQPYELLDVQQEGVDHCTFFQLATNALSLWRADRFTENPLGVVPDARLTKVLKREEHVELEGPRHFYVSVEDQRHKIDVLTDLYCAFPRLREVQIVIHCKANAKLIAKKLTELGLSVSVADANNSRDRNAAIYEFLSGASMVLVALPEFRCVMPTPHEVPVSIFYDFPGTREYYYSAVCGRFEWRRRIIVALMTQVGSICDLEVEHGVEFDELPMDMSNLVPQWQD